VKSLKAILENWKKYKPIRGIIGDIFKLAKNAFSLNNLHRYTKRSVKKFPEVETAEFQRFGGG